MFGSSDNPQPVYTFVFDDEAEVLFSLATNGQRIPLHKIKSSKKSKPNLTVARIPQNAASNLMPAIIATSTSRSWSLSGSIDISLHGRNIKMKKDPMSTSQTYSFSYPPLGNFKWKSDMWLGSSFKLFDAAGQLLARHKSNSSWKGKSEQTIELYVIGQDEFIDMVVVTALAVAKRQEKDTEEVEEVVDAVDIMHSVM
ncbi:hypothetical protein F5884DRAFT_904119 [Xylogone sp. PMI_703]|nr:hypothetical protein F5884DRAFT_904119 [Xylogone sp. PMI_703]